MDIKSLQKKELEILAYVHDFCCEHRLTYWLFHGTLLGAVRHNGFIPWDDDIDIAMPRSDYEKFIKLYDNRKYRVVSPGDEGYIYPFAKVVDDNYPIREKSRFDCGIGLYIDIYPVDSLPEDKRKAEKLIKRLWHYKILWSGAVNRKNPEAGNPLRRIYSRIFNQKRTAKLTADTDAYVRRKSEENIKSSIYYSDFSAGKKYIEKYDVEDFRPVLHSFEDREFYIPCGYDRVLTVLYGDYMTLPPEDERVPKHSFTLTGLK